MAGGPYKTGDGWYYCKWSDKRGHPKNPKKTESLKTKKKKIANKRLSILETLRGSGYHKPWKTVWYKNPQIKSIVYSGHLDLSALQNGQIVAKGITLLEAAEEYIAYKINQKGARKGWKSQKTIQSHSHTIRQFAEYIGLNKMVRDLTEDDLHNYYQRDEFESDHSKKTMRSRVNGFINFIVDQGYRSEKVDAEVDPPQTEIKKYIRKATMIEIFDKLEEMQAEESDSKYAGYSHDSTWYADFCRMNYDLGLRGIEQMKLRLGDITPSDVIVGGSFRVKTNFQRKVEIGNGLARQVVDKFTDPEFRSSDPFLSENSYLFGRSSQQTRRRISTALKEASLKVAPRLGGITMRILRHLSAMKWLMENKEKDEGTRLLLLMRRMGHKQLATTQQYLNYLPSDGII